MVGDADWHVAKCVCSGVDQHDRIQVSRVESSYNESISLCSREYGFRHESAVLKPQIFGGAKQLIEEVLWIRLRHASRWVGAIDVGVDFPNQAEIGMGGCCEVHHVTRRVRR